MYLSGYYLLFALNAFFSLLWLKRLLCGRKYRDESQGCSGKVEGGALPDLAPVSSVLAILQPPPPYRTLCPSLI